MKYDILIQCGICNGEVDQFQSEEKPEVGQRTVLGVCHKCGREDDEYGVLTVVDVDRSNSVSVTAWAVPTSAYPMRDWFTVKEVAEQLGMNKDTLWTKIKRGGFHKFQVQGYVQPVGSVTLVHRKVIESIREEQE